VAKLEAILGIGPTRRGRPPKDTTASKPRLAGAATVRRLREYNRKDVPRLRARVTNNPSFLAGTVTPRAQARRHRDIVRILLKAIGPEVTDLMLIAVKRAAELTLASEHARAVLLTSSSIGPNDLEMLTRLEGAALRAVRALGIRDNGAKPHIPLREQLAAELEADEDEADLGTTVPKPGNGESGA
jgi:hypothetical protein